MTLDYVVNPRPWFDMDAIIAEKAFQPNKGSSLLYERVERITKELYVAKRKNNEEVRS